VDYDREKKISALFRVKGLPDNWFFSNDGEIIGHRPGYIPPNVFLKILKSFIAGDKKKLRIISAQRHGTAVGFV
jgi:thioredoxin-related protein